EADVAGGDHVDAGANAAALHSGDQRNARLVETGEGFLQRGEVVPEFFRAQVRVGSDASNAVGPGEDGEIHPGGEMLAGGGDDDDARHGVAVDVLDDPGQVDPDLRRECF